MERQDQLKQWIVQVLNADQPEQNTAGWPTGWKWELVSGDASFRKYYRLYNSGKTPLIAVDAPPATEDNPLFAALSETWRTAGLPLPEVLALNADAGFMLVEDLGNTALADKLSAATAPDYYRQALNLLPALQALPAETALGTLPAYDEAMLWRELEIFTEWFLQGLLGIPMTVELRAQLDDAWKHLVTAALEQPQVLVHRDFHSRNLMLVNENALAIIDFQGAVKGPVTYDVVSLLRDCYVCWPQALVQQLSEEARQMLCTTTTGDIAPSQWQRWFDYTGMQRHVKAIGIFARLHLRDGKSNYLNDIPRTLNYVLQECGKYQEFTPLLNVLLDQVMPALRQYKLISEQAKKDLAT
ncbi:aminoglycoside phosphotransferase family protein [Pokkaliibacter sp. CJK22405]|uniref:aminoglycoside phosphotransferase family protein n=1 Tax=Pokkaliibacter sp. CJK22405 TaxID=3384615 RepID=UPI0039849DF3